MIFRNKLLIFFLTDILNRFLNPTFISTIIFSILNIFIVKYISTTTEAAKTLFLYTNIQSFSQLFSIFLIYGFFIEKKDHLVNVNPKLIFFFTSLIFFISPILSILLLLISRGLMLKYSQKTKNFDVINILFVIFYLLTILCSTNGLKYFYASLLISYLVFLFFKSGNVLVPFKINFNFELFTNSIQRCISDYMVILAPLIINFYVKNNFDEKNYVIYQLCVTSLSFSSLLSGIIERTSFDKHINNEKNLSNDSKFMMIFMIIISILSVLTLAFIFNVPKKFFFFLSFNAFVSPLFSHIYNLSRFQLKFKYLKLVGVILLINILIFIFINYYLFKNSLDFLLFSMAFVAVINIIFLKTKLNKSLLEIWK